MTNLFGRSVFVDIIPRNGVFNHIGWRHALALFCARTLLNRQPTPPTPMTSKPPPRWRGSRNKGTLGGARQRRAAHECHGAPGCEPRVMPLFTESVREAALAGRFILTTQLCVLLRKLSYSAGMVQEGSLPSRRSSARPRRSKPTYA